MGLKGVVLGDDAKEKVTNLILETLEQCAATGFEADAIEASMNTIEFRLRSLSGASMTSDDP